MTGGTRGVTEVIREGHVSCSESRKRSGRCRAAGSCAGKAVGRELLVRPAPAPPAAPQRQQARRRYPPRRNLALHRGVLESEVVGSLQPTLGPGGSGRSLCVPEELDEPSGTMAGAGAGAGAGSTGPASLATPVGQDSPLAIGRTLRLVIPAKPEYAHPSASI